MSPQLRLSTYRILAKVAEAHGYYWVRCKGSHNTFRNAHGKIVVIPDYGARPFSRRLLRKILREMDMSIEEYHDLLGEK